MNRNHTRARRAGDWVSWPAVDTTLPELTFILDLPPEVGLERAAGRDVLDPFEADTLAIHETRRAGFLAIAEREPDRCVVVDATLPEEDIAAAIWQVVRERLLGSVAAV